MMMMMITISVVTIVVVVTTVVTVVTNMMRKNVSRGERSGRNFSSRRNVFPTERGMIGRHDIKMILLL